MSNEQNMSLDCEVTTVIIKRITSWYDKQDSQNNVWQLMWEDNHVNETMNEWIPHLGTVLQ